VLSIVFVFGMLPTVVEATIETDRLSGVCDDGTMEGLVELENISSDGATIKNVKVKLDKLLESTCVLVTLAA
jgi:hypothetical protein